MKKFLLTIDNEISDGCHTFEELYEHRHFLFIALMCSHPKISWRSMYHHDKTMFDGWFIAGMDLPSGQITYHMPYRLWMMLDKSRIKTLSNAPEFDGHTHKTVLNRLCGFWRSLNEKI